MPVLALGVGSVEGGTNPLADGQGDFEGLGPRLGRDAAVRLHKKWNQLFFSLQEESRKRVESERVRSRWVLLLTSAGRQMEEIYLMEQRNSDRYAQHLYNTWTWSTKKGKGGDIWYSLSVKCWHHRSDTSHT